MPLNFTSRKEMESIFSTEGVDSRIDDVTSSHISETEEEWLADVQHEATDEVLAYLGSLYAPIALQNVRRVRRITSVTACYYLSIRRGNPAQFVDSYESIIKQLEDYRDRRILLYDEDGLPVPYNGDHSPSISNQVVDDRFPLRKLRTQTETSTGPSYPGRFEDHWPHRQR